MIVSIHACLRWSRRNLWSIAFGITGVILSGGATLLLLKQLQQVIAAWPTIDPAAWAALGGALLIRAAFGLLGGYAFGELAARALTDYRQWLFTNLMAAPVAYHDRAWSANLVSALTGDAAFIQDALGRVLPTLALHGPAALIIVALLLRMNASLLLGIALLGLPLALGVLWAGRNVRSLTRRGQQLLGQTAIAAQESLTGVRLIKAMTRESLFVRRFVELTEQHFKFKRRMAFWQALLSNVAPVGALGLGLWGAWLAQRQLAGGSATTAELSTFAAYLATLGVSGLALIQAYILIEPAIGAFQRLAQLSQSTLGQEHSSGAVIERSQGGLRLHEVCFDYPGRQAGLRDISLQIEPGETVALIGPNGAGKSTLIQLLLRFYTPQQGELYLDGQPAERIRLDAWRRQFAIVTRDPLIFSLSLAENIALGKPGASPAEIAAAARAVQLHDFIAGLPAGYASSVGEGGLQLSAGQRQRLALARVFLQNPAVVIFDEATTSLDHESELALIAALRAWTGQRTLLFVSHQPMDAWPVSRTIYLERGRIVTASPQPTR